MRIIILNDLWEQQVIIMCLTVRIGAMSSSGTNSGLNFAGVIHGNLSFTGKRVTMISPFTTNETSKHSFTLKISILSYFPMFHYSYLPLKNWYANFYRGKYEKLNFRKYIPK